MLITIWKLKKNFVIECKQEVDNQRYIYYTRKPLDKVITFKEPNSLIIQKIKAFSNKSQGAYFKFKNEIFKVYYGEILTNEFLLKSVNEFNDMIILFSYENSIIFKKDGEIIKFSNIEGKFKLLQKGESIVQMI